MIKRVCIGLVVLMMASSVMGRPSQVTLCEDPWPPWVLGEANGSVPTGGIAVQIAKAVFDQIEGVTLKMVVMPWQRCVKDVEVGRVDGMMIALRSKSRPNLVYPSPMFEGRALLFYEKQRFPQGFVWKTYDDLSPFWIGLIEASSAGNEFNQAMANGLLKIDLAPNADINFKKLRAGRVHFVVSNELVGLELIKKLGWNWDDFGVTSKPLTTAPYYMPLSAMTDAPLLIPEINQAYQNLREQGFIDSIFREYRNVFPDP